MFRRITRFVFVAGALIAATAAFAGCHADGPGVSETCTQPSTLNDGMFANRTAYFRISTQPDPTNPSTTWICYRIKAADQPSIDGRIDVNPNTGIGAARVTTDLSSRACTTTAGNVLPGPHPIEQGEILDTPIYLDAYASFAPAAWLCFEAGGLKERVMVEVPGADVADVDSNDDTGPPPFVDTTPPPLGKASTACSAGTFGASNELINAHLNGHDVFLYTAQPAQNELYVCARLSGTPSGGGRLSVKGDPGQIVRLETSTDTTPCTQDIVTLTNPPLSLKIAPVGSGPPSVCLNGTRYTIVTGPIPPVVSFTPDS